MSGGGREAGSVCVGDGMLRRERGRERGGRFGGGSEAEGEGGDREGETERRGEGGGWREGKGE